MAEKPWEGSFNKFYVCIYVDSVALYIIVNKLAGTFYVFEVSLKRS